MDKIRHQYVHARGLKLHIAEAGTGDKVVVFLHGFPEIWYSWRYQMIALASAGYRAIAPDVRGYGLSEVPKEPEKSTFLDLVYDLAAIFDSLAISKGFVIGKDFGALTAYQFAILHPGRVKGVVTCGAPYLPPDEFGKSISQLPEGFYMSRWREPGRAEADFARFQVKTVVRKIYVLFSKSELPIAEADKEVLDLVFECDPLPSWFTEQDLSAYADLYKRSGFRTGLQVTYRSGGSVKFPVTNPTIRSPALLIMGEKDFFLQLPGIEGQIRSGAVKKHVPNLEVKFLPQGSHFVQEQFPDKVNQLIIAFLRKHM